MMGLQLPIFLSLTVFILLVQAGVIAQVTSDATTTDGATVTDGTGTTTDGVTATTDGVTATTDGVTPTSTSLAPVWSAATETTSVSENVTSATVTVTSTLSNNPTSIEIVSSNGTDAATLFSVSLSGSNVNLVTTSALDRETTAQYILVLNAGNAIGNTATDLELTINVLDVNDNDPVFHPAYKCKEMDDGTSGPAAVETLTATDADTTANGLGATPYAFYDPGEFTYMRAQVNRLATAVLPTIYYDMNAATGAVTVKSNATLSKGTHVLHIKATDQGTPALTGTGSIIVCTDMKCCSAGCCSGAPPLHGKAAALLSSFFMIMIIYMY